GMFRRVQQDEKLVLVYRIAMLLQLQPAQVPAHGADLREHQIGLNLYGLSLLARSCNFLRNGSLAGRELLPRRGRDGATGWRLSPLRRRCRRMRRLLLPLPGVEQQEDRKREDEEQYETLRIHVDAIRVPA